LWNIIWNCLFAIYTFSKILTYIWVTYQSMHSECGYVPIQVFAIRWPIILNSVNHWMILSMNISLFFMTFTVLVHGRQNESIINSLCRHVFYAKWGSIRPLRYKNNFCCRVWTTDTLCASDLYTLAHIPRCPCLLCKATPFDFSQDIACWSQVLGEVE
jgi:hypothetical protein